MSNEFLGQTTLKILINDWIKLREIIGIISKSKRTALSPITESDLSLALVSDEAIQDAFHGPYHVLVKTLSEGYALISKLRAYTIITQDEALKSHIQKPDMSLPEHVKKQVTAATLDKLQRELDELSGQHFALWQERIQNWQGQILMQLTAEQAELSDPEIAELTDCEPLFELKRSYVEHNLRLPKTKGDAYSISDYLKAKILFTLHSALGRQLKPHTQEDLEKRLKSFKSLFKEIDQEEGKLGKQLKHETETIIKKLT